MKTRRTSNFTGRCIAALVAVPLLGLLAGVARAEACVAAADSLAAGFANPPRTDGPVAWWHWMNGNVSREGITADLEAMAEAGFSGVQLFDEGCGIAPGPVGFATDEWYALALHAHNEAKRLGLELTVNNGSGWSNSGGPWVRPEDGMKDLVSAELTVGGPRRFVGKLSRAFAPLGYYEDVAVVAVPLAKGARAPAALPGATVERNVRNGVFAWTFRFPAPQEATEFRFSIRGPTDVPWRTLGCCSVIAEGAEDGRSFVRLAAETNHSFRTGLNAELKPRTLGFPLARARAYRLTVDLGAVAERGFVVEGVEPGTFPRVPAKAVLMRNGQLMPSASMPPLEPSAAAVDKARIVDLTAKMGADGTLDWEVPSGAWTVLRIGCTSNGQTCSPASDKGRGLEVDRLSAASLRRFFDAHVGKLAALCGIDPKGGSGRRAGLVGVLVDSYEKGGQSWTPGLEHEFLCRAGYDIRPYLPAFAGFLVGSADETERFFADFRRVLSEVFIENYPDAYAALCHARGLSFAQECYGNFPADNPRWSWNVDRPMGEFWCHNDDIAPHRQVAGKDITPRSDKPDSARFFAPLASVVHQRGLRYFAAEAFTSFPADGRWQQDPWSFKQPGDAAFCGGVNRLCLQSWVHQPWTNPPRMPGVTLGAFGAHFGRNEPWWPFAKPWIAYLTRCQHLLQQGRFVPDLLVASGEEKSVPEGYKFDVYSPATAPYLTVRDGRVVAPSGLTYPAVVSSAPPSAWVRAGVRFVTPAQLAAGALPRAFVSDRPVNWTRFALEDGTMGYFVAWPGADAADVTCSFAVAGRVAELWNAETGEIARARGVREENGLTRAKIPFAPRGSWFVMFRPAPTAGIADAVAPAVVRAETLSGAWKVSFPVGWYFGRDETKATELPSLVDWTTLADPDFRYFSGIATYEYVQRPTVRFAAGERIVLDLGGVKNLAEVTVNGKAFAPVWRPPFRVDITSAVRSGEPIDLRVRVANLWVNRLIGDEELPSDVELKSSARPIPGIVWGEPIAAIPEFVRAGRPSPTGRHTFATWHHWYKGDRLFPSGLLGPVRLQLVK